MEQEKTPRTFTKNTVGDAATPSKLVSGERTIKKPLGRRRQIGDSARANKRFTTKSIHPSPTKAEHRTSTPNTVAQAQELGELARIQDDISWAMDGLASQKLSEQEESLGSLVDLLGSRKGKLAMQKGYISLDVLAAVGKLNIGESSILALGSSILLLLFTLGGSSIVFRSDTPTRLAGRLLKCHKMPDISSPIYKKMVKILNDPYICRLVPTEASSAPVSVCLCAISFTLEAWESREDITPIKQKLREEGVLYEAVILAVQQGDSLNDPFPTMETVQCLWRLHKCLFIFEHACFACHDNEAYLSHMNIEHGVPPFVTEISLVKWLLMQVGILTHQTIPESGLKKECMRGILAVLMNITQENEDGCKLVLASGGVDTLCSCIQALVYRMDGEQLSMTMEHLKKWIDETSACLGVLINLSEWSKIATDKIASVRFKRGETSKNKSISMLEFLIALFMVSGRHHDPPPYAPDVQNEVTLDSLQHGEGEAVGSIIEVYCGILVAFIVMNNPMEREKAKNLLPGSSLYPITQAVQNCLAFYTSAGAMTPKTEQSLKNLLQKLHETGS